MKWNGASTVGRGRSDIGLLRLLTGVLELDAKSAAINPDLQEDKFGLCHSLFTLIV